MMVSCFMEVIKGFYDSNLEIQIQKLAKAGQQLGDGGHWIYDSCSEIMPGLYHKKGALVYKTKEIR